MNKCPIRRLDDGCLHRVRMYAAAALILWMVRIYYDLGYSRPVIVIAIMVAPVCALEL